MDPPGVPAAAGGLTFADCFIVEVFCGKAGLSRALRRKGFQVFSVDHKAVKGIPILMIDLNVSSQRQLFEDLLAQGRLLYVHFAPPCGTASMARTIRLRGRPGPKPLRSLRYPMGLPNLGAHDKQRVLKANLLYKLTCVYTRKLDQMGVGWSIENPSASLMWVTSPFSQLMFSLGAKCIGVTFHTCMFGSRRKKTTALWTSVAELQQLHRICDNSHEHDGWGLTPDGSFATAQECAYDPILCAHWADATCAYAQRLGFQEPPLTLSDVTSDHLDLKDKANRAIVGALPRGTKVPPLLTDFLEQKQVAICDFPFLQQAKPGGRLADSKFFPKGARLLRFLNDQRGFDGMQAVIGLPVEPRTYISWACTLVHPNTQPVKMPVGMERAIQLHSPGASVELRKARIAWTRTMLSLYKLQR